MTAYPTPPVVIGQVWTRRADHADHPGVSLPPRIQIVGHDLSFGRPGVAYFRREVLPDGRLGRSDSIGRAALPLAYDLESGPTHGEGADLVARLRARLLTADLSGAAAASVASDDLRAVLDALDAQAPLRPMRGAGAPARGRCGR